MTAVDLAGNEHAQVALRVGADGEGAADLRQKLSEALSVPGPSLRIVLPGGELLRQPAAAPLPERLVRP